MSWINLVEPALTFSNHGNNIKTVGDAEYNSSTQTSNGNYTNVRDHINKIYFAHTEPILKSFNILPLNSLYYHIIGLLMYKLSNRLLPEVLNELYIKKNKIHHYPTRNCDKYHIQTSTDSFSNVSARIWNVIITNIDVNISFMQFKIVL